MKEMIIFENENFGELEILEINGKFEFAASETARMLGYATPRDAIKRHCKKDGVVKHDVIDRLGRKQVKNFITEGNLYRLITHSNLPGAEKFESWVFDEVLPSIRRTGPFNDNTSKLLEALTNNQINTNNVLLGFKNQMDDTARTLKKHEEMLAKRVYLTPRESKIVSDAVKNKAKEIAMDFNLNYLENRNNLFKRLYSNLKDKFEVASYRELPSADLDKILEVISNSKIYIKDLKNKPNQLQITINCK